MQIDKTLILKLENLAQLECSEEERNLLIRDLNKILAMMSKLEELDTQLTEPLVYLSDAIASLRPDDIAHQVSQQEALANAPDSDGRFFRTPKVVDL